MVHQPIWADDQASIGALASWHGCAQVSGISFGLSEFMVSLQPALIVADGSNAPKKRDGDGASQLKKQESKLLRRQAFEIP
jgi:hypothetical protein